MSSYEPSPAVKEILEWALEKIKAVPYEVSLRWIFYRVLQEKGLSKDSYKSFIKWTSRARKGFWNGWDPTTLIDDTRKIHQHGYGFSSVKEWVEAQRANSPYLDKNSTQDSVIIVMFEAEAMYKQFEHYAAPYHVSLIPFKGDASINHKWKISKFIEAIHSQYNKPVHVLYYGDLDPKGLEIPENALRDMRVWCRCDFDYTRIGLTEEQVEEWNIPDNPERPGQYQWEALDDPAAGELITKTLAEHLDLEKIKKVEALEDEASAKWQSAMDDIEQYFAEDYDEDKGEDER
jgi:hypothetical protein